MNIIHMFHHVVIPSGPKTPRQGFAFPRAHKRRQGCMYRLTSPYNQALVFAAGDYFERASRILNPAVCFSSLFQFRRVLKSLLEIVVSWWLGAPSAMASQCHCLAVSPSTSRFFAPYACSASSSTSSNLRAIQVQCLLLILYLPSSLFPLPAFFSNPNPRFSFLVRRMVCVLEC